MSLNTQNLQSLDNVTFDSLKESFEELRVRPVLQGHSNRAWVHPIDLWCYIRHSYVLEEVKGWDVNTVTFLKYKVVVCINVLQFWVLLEIWLEKAHRGLVRHESQSLNNCPCFFISDNLSLTSV